jgi:hypothetical protein
MYRTDFGQNNRPFAARDHVIQRDKKISYDDKMIDIFRKSTLKKVSIYAEFERFLT